MEQTPHPRQTRIRAIRSIIVQGAERFDPRRHAARLLPAADELWGTTGRDREALRARLKAALRSERRRGRAGHWSYDLNRHLGLLQALKSLGSAKPR